MAQESSLHMAYGQITVMPSTAKRRLKFTGEGAGSEPNELLRQCRPHIIKRVLDARIARQRSAASS